MVDENARDDAELEFAQHSTKSEWGIGRVLHRTDGGARIHIVFEHGGRKVLRGDPDLLQSVDGGQVSQHSLLRHLSEDVMAGNLKRRLWPFARVAKAFVKAFPGGLEDEEFGAQNRRYAADARAYVQEHLARDRMTEMLESGAFTDLFKDARKLMTKTTGTFHVDQSKLGSIPVAAHPEFCRALFELLHGQASFAERFDGWIAFLEPHGAAKWPLASYFPFVAMPEDHCLVKPNVLRPAAELVGFELRFTMRPELVTYEQVLKFCAYLREQLADAGLSPRDNVDAYGVAVHMGMVLAKSDR